MAFFDRPRLEDLAEPSQRSGVDLVGFGESVVGAGEVADLPRVDDRDAVPRGDQFGGEELLVSARGLGDDAARSRGRESLNE